MALRYLFLLVCLVPVQAQDQSSISETLKVHLHKVQVRVADKKGNPVRGLKKDDFLLTERGDRVKLDFVEEVDESISRASEATAKTSSVDAPADPTTATGDTEHVDASAKKPSRILVVMFDSSTMSRRIFQEAKPQLQTFLNDWIRPGDQIVLTQTEMTTRQLVPITTSKELVHQALEDMAYGGRFFEQMRALQNEINGLMADISNGRSIGGSDPLKAKVNKTVEFKARLKRDHLRTFLHNVKLLGRMMATNEGSKHLLLVTSGGYLDVDTTDEFDRATYELNHQGVVIHSLLIKDRVVNVADVNINMSSLDELAKTKVLKTSSSVDGKYNSQNTVMEDGRQLETAPFNAAVQTGGTFLRTHKLKDNVILERLQEIGERADHYYVLWYQSEDPTRKVDLELTQGKKNWELFFGKDSKPPDAYQDLSPEDHQIAFSSALMYQKDVAFLDAQFSAHLFGSAKKGYQIPIDGLLGEMNQPGSYEIGLALMDEASNFLAVRQHMIKIQQTGEISFYDTLFSEVYPGMVRAMVTHMETGQRTLVSLGLTSPGGGLSTSSILLLSGGNPPPLFLSSNRQEAQDTWNPFAVGEENIIPQFGNVFQKPDQLSVFFQLQNRLSKGENYEVFVAVVKDGKVQDASVKSLFHSDVDEETTSYLCALDTSLLNSGDYTLYIKVVNPNKEEQVITHRGFMLTTL